MKTATQETQKYTLSYMLALIMVLNMIEEQKGPNEFITQAKSALEHINRYIVEDAPTACLIIQEIVNYIEQNKC